MILDVTKLQPLSWDESKGWNYESSTFEHGRQLLHYNPPWRGWLKIAIGFFPQEAGYSAGLATDGNWYLLKGGFLSSETHYEVLLKSPDIEPVLTTLRLLSS